MAIKLVTTVEDGLGTVAKSIVCNTDAEYQMLKKVIFHGINLYPDTPPAMKALYEQMHGERTKVEENPSAVHKCNYCGSIEGVTRIPIGLYRCHGCQEIFDSLPKPERIK